MTPEEFKSTYQDTHTEFQVLDLLEKGGSLIKVHPGDKNISVRGKIPGKALIESKEMEKRQEGLSHCLFDAVGARVGDLMEIQMDKLVALAIKSAPQKIDQKIEGNFTFAEMVKIASTENTIEVEIDEVQEDTD